MCEDVFLMERVEKERVKPTQLIFGMDGSIRCI